MRRKDREVTDEIKIRDIIGRCHCCRLGFNDEGRVYIVPLSFGCAEANGVYTFYFHGAREGRKMELIQKNPDVGFEMDTHYKLNEAVTACGHSARFQSVIGAGRVHMVTEPEEKKHGLQLIMEHNTGNRDWDFAEDMLRAVAVFRLEVGELSCKEHF